MAILQIVSDVDNISGKEVTSSRDLNLNTDSGNDCLIVTKSLYPIDIARLRLNPLGKMGESFVNKLANTPCSVRLLLVKNANICGNKNLLKLKKNMCQSEAAYFLPRSPVETNLAYLHS